MNAITRENLNYLIYRDGEVKVCFSGNNIFIDSNKPVFSFDYDELVYEPLESFQNKFIIYNGYTVPLGSQHIDEIETYLTRFIKNDIDFEVYVYDKNRSNLFKDVMFKKEAGITFSEYLTNVRMEKAKELLKETNFTVASICEKVGYSDLKSFTKVFAKYTNLKPNEYRKIYS